MSEPRATVAYPKLFSKLSIGSKVAKNRIVRSATTTNLAEKNDISDRFLAHYVTLAKGGPGIIISEGMRPHPALVSKGSNIPAFSEKVIPGLARWADAMHAENCLIFGQVHHSGRQHTATTVPGRLIGPSAIACPRSGGVPHAMSDAEIRDYIAHNVLSAKNLNTAGFDGLEVHGAQGHLIQQFLSPFSNRRTDEWGGSWDKRKRLPTRLLTEIRNAVPKGFVLGYRMGIEEFTEGGWDVAMSIQLLREFVADGLLDYASLSQGNFNTIDTHLPDRHYPMTPYVKQQAEVKAGVDGITIIASTRIMSPDQAEQILATGAADAIALGRALTVDPNWPRKAKAGRAEDIRLCISCNHCWDGLHEGTTPLTCVHNPMAGREFDLGELKPAAAAKRVVVVGGGPGGMETARVAAQRGHHTVLFEKTSALGGKSLSGAEIGGHAEYANVAHYLAREVAKAGVDVRLNTLATTADILKLRPDAVVLATGATPVVPEIASDGSIPVYESIEATPADLSGKAVLMADEDGYWWGAQCAEELARRGAHVVLLTRFYEPFRELPSVSRIAALRALDFAGCEVLALHEIAKIASNSILIRHYSSGKERSRSDIDAVLFVGPQRVNDALEQELKSAGMKDVHLIGDVFAPRRLRHAIFEGHQLGRKL